MRSRSNSGVRLDYYQRMVAKTIMRHQVNLVVNKGLRTFWATSQFGDRHIGDKPFGRQMIGRHGWHSWGTNRVQEFSTN